MKKLEAILNESASREEYDALGEALDAFTAKDVQELGAILSDWVSNASTGDKRELAQKLSYEIQQNI